MDIERKDFEKVNQLNRIEYRQILKEINDRDNSSWTLSLAKLFMIFYAYFLLLDLLELQLKILEGKKLWLFKKEFIIKDIGRLNLLYQRVKKYFRTKKR